MTIAPISREQVLQSSHELPGLPTIIFRILESIDDPEANLAALAEEIRLDPLITSRVVSMANAAALHARHQRPIEDLHTAISMIGLESVRSIAITCCFPKLCGDDAATVHRDFIRHSIAVSACCRELAQFVDAPVPPETAAITGLLHDIGRLWLLRFESERFMQALDSAARLKRDITQMEQELLGCDHATIGLWLAEHWRLPQWACLAIHRHHTPELADDDALTALVHVAEVLSHALELPGYRHNQVTHLSAAACRRLDLVWDNGSQELFSRIEAQSRYANRLLD
ncbi:MAG: HDOD domain-containing protein [Pseudomonadota bacterium]